MKKLAILSAAVGLFCGLPLSIEWSQTNGPALSVNSAEARVGRPRTATSVAGVARRTTRRATRRALIYCTAPGYPVGCVWR
jgi:hypothetical protein